MESGKISNKGRGGIPRKMGTSVAFSLANPFVMLEEQENGEEEFFLSQSTLVDNEAMREAMGTDPTKNPTLV